jgi:hypothetical protein
MLTAPRSRLAVATATRLRAWEQRRPARVDQDWRNVMKTTTTNRLLSALALFASLLSAGTALAQDSRASRSSNDDWVPVKHLEFTPDDIEGGLLGPKGEQITSVPRAEHPSLIEIRAGFEAEVVKTMENM